MSGWTTATGETEASTSNLMTESTDRSLMELAARHREAEIAGQQNPSRGKSDETAQYQRTGVETQFDQGIVLDQGIIASTRDAGGGLIFGRNPNETDQVTLPGGIPTSIKVAIGLGYLQRNGDGTFSEVAASGGNGGKGGGNVAAAAGGDDEDGEGDDSDEPAQFLISQDASTAMAEIADTTDHGTAIKAVDEIIMLGDVSENTLGHLASQAGIEPEQMAEKLDTVHAGFYNSALSHLAGRGVTNSDAFESFVTGNPQMLGKMTEAVRDLVMNRGTGALDNVADAFLEKADLYMTDDIITSLDDAGWKHMPNGKGGLLVVTEDGMQIPFQVAVRQRVIRFV